MTDRIASNASCAGDSCGCNASRRDFLAAAGASTLAMLTAELPVMAGPFESPASQPDSPLVPADKKLDPAWLASLTARGEPTIYRGRDLQFIGMPIGGLCAGQLYLGGDGKLWHWDIFNAQQATGSQHYAQPLNAASARSTPDQGFALRLGSGPSAQVRPLDTRGFKEVSFLGQYPIGQVQYRDPESPVSVTLEAYSPFIPLDVENSSFPATIMAFTLKNDSASTQSVEIGGWLENRVARKAQGLFRGLRQQRRLRLGSALLIESRVQPVAPDANANAPVRPTMVLADFEAETWAEWKVEGHAFGRVPAAVNPSSPQKLQGVMGKHLANSFVERGDSGIGKLISPPFKIERRYINFRIGGGDHMRPDGQVDAGINLIVDGKVVRNATGNNSDTLSAASWEVSELEGHMAHVEIVDAVSGAWGHVDIDQIEQADTSPLTVGSLLEQNDVGTMALALLSASPGARALPMIGADFPRACFAAESPETLAEKNFQDHEPLVGAVVESLLLAPGESRRVEFVLAWHFPHLIFPMSFTAGATSAKSKVEKGRYYATRFDSARSVIAQLAQQGQELSRATRLWRQTWYDSTLPHWFLDRTLLTISTLATNTVYRFANGRFYGWEGVGCCEGTCTHVWHYEQAMGRLFPELDINLREKVDFNPDLGFNPQTGGIGQRGELVRSPAADGQAGTILRAYRDHLTAPDGGFLERNWPAIKQSIAYLITLDTNGDGLLEAPQSNTLDGTWFGLVPWISGLYLAALRAGEQMAMESHDPDFAARCRSLAAAGKEAFAAKMFNGEYFEQIPDPSKLEHIGSYNGCEIDQVLGQGWAFQVGLGRVLPEKQTRQALNALWKYNFSPDVGPYRQKYKSGRWYAMAGEAGTLMCSWPRGDKMRVLKGFDYYFNECMNGFEHQLAGHLIWEGMLTEGLAMERALHDRYHGSKRNPWNEVECGDHYARSMASYGVFLAACGFEYHGPQGHIGFAPRLTPEDFKAPFTAAAGWGSFSQKRAGGKLTATLELKWGQLRLRTLALASEPMKTVVVRVAGGAELASSMSSQEGRLLVTLSGEVMLKAGESLVVEIG